MKYYVINIELKSVDVFENGQEAVDLVNYFLESNYKMRDLRVIKGNLLPMTAILATKPKDGKVQEE